jgi:hypothetical protein
MQLLQLNRCYKLKPFVHAVGNSETIEPKSYINPGHSNLQNDIDGMQTNLKSKS